MMQRHRGFAAINMVHGHLLDSSQWDDQLAAFAHHYQVIRYDARGFGQLDLPPAPFAYHEDLHALLQILGIDHAYLMGCSGGGATIKLSKSSSRNLNNAKDYPESDSANDISRNVTASSTGHSNA